MLAALDLISNTLQPHAKFGTIHAGRIVLRLEEGALLESAGLAVFALCHIEDNGVGVKLRRGIAIDRTSGVMLEGSGDELAGCLRCMDVANAGLGIPLQFAESNADALAVRLAHTIISSDKGGEGNRLWR